MWQVRAAVPQLSAAASPHPHPEKTVSGSQNGVHSQNLNADSPKSDAGMPNDTLIATPINPTKLNLI